MFFFVLNNILAIYLSVILSRPLAGDGPDSRRLLIAIANFALIVYAVVIATGGGGVLSSESIFVILISVNLCVTFLNRRQPEYSKKSLPDNPPSLQKNTRDTIFFKLSLVLFTGFWAEWVYKSFIAGTYFGPDDFVYHAGIAAQWIVDREITLVPFTYQTYYPFNAELLSIWFMLPFHSDAYASITSFYWGLLSLAAIFAIQRSFKFTLTSSLIVGALFIGSSGVQGTSVQKILQSFSANDLAGPAMLLAALAVLLTADGLTTRGRFTNSLYCGLLTGFALGIKIYFAPVVFILLLWFFIPQNGFDAFSFKQRTNAALLFTLGLTLTCGFWYARNYVITGNPLFPAEFGPFSGPLDLEAQYRTKLISWIRQSPTDLNQWLRIARGLVNWPLQFGVIAMIGYLAAIWFLISKRLSKVKDVVVWRGQALLLLTGLVLFLAFFFLPFSATTNHPTTGLKVAERYVIFSYAIGLLLLSRLIDRNSRGPYLLKVLALLSLTALPVYEKNFAVITVSAIAAAVVCFRTLEERVMSVLKLKHTGALLLVLSLVFLAYWHPYKKKMTDEIYYSSIGPAGQVFKKLENLPDDSRIGYFSTLPYNNTPFYRLFGRRLQMIPVPLDYDGSVPRPLHVRPLGKNDTWWAEWDKLDREINEREFQLNIRQSSVQYVILAQFPYNRWPSQYHVIKNMENVEQIYNDGHSAIWKVL